MKRDLLFFTCATGYYENFVVPYIYFAEKHNPGSAYEFIVNDPAQFAEKHRVSLDWLNNRFGVVPVVRGRDARAVRPKMENSLRFITEPKQAAAYVYIGDVDIMVLENILAWHKPVFDAGLPYSNIVREGTRRLSGLHLTRYEALYPLPPCDDLVADTPNDEELLYKIVERQGKLYDTAIYKKLVRGRPLHGIHMSLNRLPFSAHTERVSWGIAYAHAEKCDNLVRSPEFEEFFSTLYKGSSQIVMNLVYLSRGICAYGKDFFTKRVTP